MNSDQNSHDQLYWECLHRGGLGFPSLDLNEALRAALFLELFGLELSGPRFSGAEGTVVEEVIRRKQALGIIPQSPVIPFPESAPVVISSRNTGEAASWERELFEASLMEFIWDFRADKSTVLSIEIWTASRLLMDKVSASCEAILFERIWKWQVDEGDKRILLTIQNTLIVLLRVALEHGNRIEPWFLNNPCWWNHNWKFSHHRNRSLNTLMK